MIEVEHPTLGVLEFPDGTDQATIVAAIKQAEQGSAQPAQQMQAPQPVEQAPQQQEPGFFQQAWERNPFVVGGDILTSMVSGIGGQIAGGISGIGTALVDGPEAGGQTAKDVSHALTYQPENPRAQQMLQELSWIGKGFQALQNLTGTGAEEIARGFGVQPGTPAAATAYAVGSTIPDAVASLIPGGRATKLTQAEQAAARAAPRGEEALRQMTGSVQTAESARVGTRPREAALEDLAVQSQPQPAIGQAFEESGIQAQAVPPEVLSGSTEYRQLAGAARSVPASPANVQYRQFLDDVSRRVDEMATESGAMSADDLNFRVAETVQKNIDDARSVERQAYELLEGSDSTPGLIQPTAQVDITPLFDTVMKKIEDVGGNVMDLTPADRRILSRIATRMDDGTYQPRDMTFAGLTNLRKELNAARSGKGSFMNAAEADVERYANAVSATTRRNAEAMGYGDEYAAAMEATAVKKRAQQAAQDVLGKKLDRSFTAIMDAKVGQLSRGRVDEFNKVMDSLPADVRKDAATSYVFGKAINRGNMDARLDIAGFNKWYNQLDSNPRAKAALYKHLDKDTRKMVDNIGKMTSAIKRANEDIVKTGLIDSLDEGFKLADSFVGRLGRLAIATKVPVVGGIAADAAASSLAKSSRRVSQAASDLMGSPDFHSYVGKVMANPEAAAARAAERELAKSPAWRRMYVSLPKAERDAIRNLGITQWLQRGQEEAENGGNGGQVRQ